MSTRVLVMGAGGGASNNLISSLRSALPGVVPLGANDDPFTLRNSIADRNYLLSPADDSIEGIGRVVTREGVDLIIPSNDTEVRQLSDGRDTVANGVFLPPKAIIELCQDKCDLAGFLAERGIPVPVSFAVTAKDALDDLFGALGGASLVWCRTRSGSRSRGAAPVSSARQALGWIEHWEELHGIDPASFMLAEYLPGRDFFCQTLWQAGRLVLVKTCERVAYFGAENSPSGVSSLYSLAKTVVDDRIVDVSVRAMRAIDPLATGAFGIDLKENADGVPCVTEINAGRLFFGMTTIGSLGKHNLVECYVRLGLGETLAFDDAYDCPPDYYVVRDVDTAAGIFHVDDILHRFLRPDE